MFQGLSSMKHNTDLFGKTGKRKLSDFRTPLILLGIGVLFLGLLWQLFFAHKRPVAKDPSQFGIMTEQVSAREGAAGEISIRYPKTESETINQFFLSYVEGKQAIFSKELSALPERERTGKLSVAYEIFPFHEKIISFLLMTESAVGSGNSVQWMVDVFIFDLTTGTQFQVSELFQGKEYPNVLSQYVIRHLQEETRYAGEEGEEKLRLLTNPVTENYRLCALEDNFLWVFLSDKEATENAPLLRTSIPLSDLKGCIKEEILADASLTPGSGAEAPQTSDWDAITLPSGIEEKKLIALTFDDGPNPVQTPKLLSVLKTEGVPATFFVLGTRGNQYPALVHQAYEEGHQIASHTYQHKNLVSLSEEEKQYEIQQPEVLIREITGKNSVAVRPPYGAFDQTITQKVTGSLILWSVDPKDWQTKNVDRIVANTVSAVKDGDIVLLHDIYGTTVEAVPHIIRALKEQNYAFVTVEQLIKVRRAEMPQPGEVIKQLWP